MGTPRIQKGSEMIDNINKVTLLALCRIKAARVLGSVYAALLMAGKKWN